MADHPLPPPPPENPPIARDVTSAIRGEQPTVHIPHPEMHALLAPGHDFASVTEKISSIVLRKGTPLWWFAMPMESLTPCATRR